MTDQFDIELKLRVLCFRRVLFIRREVVLQSNIRAGKGWLDYKDPGGDTDTVRELEG